MQPDSDRTSPPPGPSSPPAAAPIHISAKAVGKKFDIYVNDRGRVFELFTRKQFHEEFWALKDISFEVPKGCAYGVIGSNGAGKSTLLKMLAGVSRPTVGELKINGSISSLLDLGLGFHQNFTGRQNIYLNCTLLGLSRPEIDHLLSDIVAFAELESFIDYPVKTYSSGMSLRLGFSIASHLNYDIFLIDEVLTVGDQYFQRKCVRKIEEFIDQGRTIVLVSHDLHSVRSLCDKVLWLKEGNIVIDGPAAEVVDAYVDAVRAREGAPLRPRPVPLPKLRRPPAEDGPVPRGTPAESVDPASAVDPASTAAPDEAAPRGELASGPDGNGAGAAGTEAPLEPGQKDELVDLLLKVLRPEETGEPGSMGAAGSNPGAGDGDSGSAGEAGAAGASSQDPEAGSGSQGSTPSAPALPTAEEVAPLRAEKAARFQHPQHTHRAGPVVPARLAYRATRADADLRRRILSATALENAEALWAPGEEVSPFMEYHGDLPLITGSGEARILEVLILGPDGQPREEFLTGEMVTVAVTVKALEPVDNPIFGVAIHRNDDVYVYGPNTRFDQCLQGTYHGLYTFFLHYPSLPLLAGSYLLSVAFWDKNHLKPYVWHNRLYTIRFKADREDHGLVVIPHVWGVVTHLAGAREELEDPVTDPSGEAP